MSEEHSRKGKHDLSERKMTSGGSCTKCSCPSFRGDSDDPERCVNIRPPTNQLCGHTRAEHR
jgi:hypothetical protein